MAALLWGASGAAVGQAEARPMLGGTVYLADTLMSSGTVVLHHVSQGSQGELDSMAVERDGSFSFALPSVPDPGRGDIFFASVRHHGVLYFGPAITRALELDSIYEIHAYDTLMATEEVSVALEGRSIFFEVEGPDLWRVTDLFQLRNDTNRTIVAGEGSHTWRYPLPPDARDVSAGDGESSFDAASYEGGEMVVRAALPPGERLFVARYTVATPFIALPTPGVTEVLDVLVQEPVPPLEIPGLAATDRIELEAGSTFRRYSAENFSADEVVLVETDELGPPPVEWFAVGLAMILTLVAVVMLRARASAPAAAAGGTASRREVLLEVARLDEEFEAMASPSKNQRRAYQRRRAELLAQIRPAE